MQSLQSAYSISLDRHLAQRLGRRPPEIGLFTKTECHRRECGAACKGRYTSCRSKVSFFEEGSHTEAKLVVYGQVYGTGGH